jgi:hypothetical protein
MEMLKDSENISKAGGVPRDTQHRSDCSPLELGKKAIKENMAHILRTGTQHTVPI